MTTIEELTTFLAQRGEVELLQILKHIQSEYDKHIDPDYEIVESSSDCESECSSTDLIEEQIEVNPSLNGFHSLA